MCDNIKKPARVTKKQQPHGVSKSKDATDLITLTSS